MSPFCQSVHRSPSLFVFRRGARQEKVTIRTLNSNRMLARVV